MLENSTNNIYQFIKTSSQELNKHGITNGLNEIIWYLEKLNLCRREELYFNKVSKKKNKDIKLKIKYFMNERINKKPFQYILGETFFYGRKFILTNKVLIPRPESEMFIEVLKKKQFKTGLDLGTGSGNLAITLLLEKICEKMTAIDICRDALKIAQQNAVKYKIDRINFLNKNILKEKLNKKFDLIVSNPPYISMKNYNILPKSIKNFEPQKALTDNQLGLSFYSRYKNILPDILKQGGTMLLEIGICHTPKEIQKIFKNYNSRVHFDYNKIPRIVEIRNAN